MINFNKIATFFVVAIFSVASTHAMMSKEKREKGWLEVICGPMYAGKSTKLLLRLNIAELADLKTLALKHAFDNRYDDTNITTHDGEKHSALAIRDEESEPARILELAKDVDVVGIDEIQFFKEPMLAVIDALINDGKRIIVAGLDLDFRGETFPPIMSKLLEKADE